MKVQISLSARVLVNVEALNMVESIGNYVRHRRVPVVTNGEGGQELKYVPALSGESLAHGYQENLANLAAMTGIAVCDSCRSGTFTKHSSKVVFGNTSWEQELKELLERKNNFDPNSFEEKLIQNCIVEDIGGFLYAEEPTSVKRTSLFSTGYVIPALDSLRSAALEPQFHVRYAPGKVEEAQAIYYVEAGSALYTFNFNINISEIGKTHMLNIKDVIGKNERSKRVEIAIKALGITLAAPLFGAKRSRFLPSWEVHSIVLAISSPVQFEVSPGHSKKYLANTVKRANAFTKALNGGSTNLREKITIYYFETEGLEQPERAIETVVVKPMSENLESLFADVINEIGGYID